jgi:hypothetical protein
MDASNIDPADLVCEPDAVALNQALQKYVDEKEIEPPPFRGSGCDDPDCDICV